MLSVSNPSKLHMSYILLVTQFHIAPEIALCVTVFHSYLSFCVCFAQVNLVIKILIHIHC